MDFDFLCAEARDLCSRLLKKDPAERLGSGETDAEEIKFHPWFECIDWKKIENK
jgi:serine/threonine protein kinase